MKSQVDLFLRLAILSALSSCCVSALAAQPPKPPAPSPKTEVVEPEVVTSSFTIPVTPKDGKDPFFPNSTQRFAGPATKPSASAPAAPPKMILMGISGTPQRRLAIINGRTFGKGEEQDVSLPSGHLHIRCLDIKEDSVIIEVNGEHQELRLRAGL